MDELFCDGVYIKPMKVGKYWRWVVNGFSLDATQWDENGDEIGWCVHTRAKEKDNLMTNYYQEEK